MKIHVYVLKEYKPKMQESFLGKKKVLLKFYFKDTPHIILQTNARVKGAFDIHLHTDPHADLVLDESDLNQIVFMNRAGNQLCIDSL